jgi:hypothetical protein
LFGYIKQVILRLKPLNFKLDLLMGRVIVLIRYFRDFTIARKQHIKKKISKNGSLSLDKSKFNEISVTEVFQKFVKSDTTKIFLKIDIEGSEYEIIEQTMIYHKQIRIIVVEFHDIIRKIEQFEQLFTLLKSKYSLIHTHINNNGLFSNEKIPEICEFTFISSKDFQGFQKVDSIPLLGKDYPNNKYLPDFQIDFNET